MLSSIEERKEKLILDLVEARKNILNAASALPTRQREVVFLGSWSVMDLLAHLLGWDYTNMEAVDTILSDQVPGFFASYDEDWRTYNSRLVAQYKVDDFSKLVKAMKKSHGELIRLLRSIPAQEFDRDRGLRSNGDEVTIADLLQTELKDERLHHQQIAEFGSEKNTPV